ncbi:hypothetical protein B0H34DRAFT_679469 [Crassisporium funariophilum]|nr:hypothetical protein B0H34DRAFT_679469 [Crassisporium funariophilum]
MEFNHMGRETELESKVGGYICDLYLCGSENIWHRPFLSSSYHDQDVMKERERGILGERWALRQHGSWRNLKYIPDPKDPNPLRYAMLAATVESMAECYSYKISLGLRRGAGVLSRAQDRANFMDPNKPFEDPPSWSSDVPAVEESTSFLPDRAIINYGHPFHNRRISVNPEQLRNI